MPLRRLPTMRSADVMRWQRRAGWLAIGCLMGALAVAAIWAPHPGDVQRLPTIGTGAVPETPAVLKLVTPAPTSPPPNELRSDTSSSPR